MKSTFALLLWTAGLSIGAARADLTDLVDVEVLKQIAEET